MEVVINPKYDRLKDFIGSIPDRFPVEGKTIYKSRNEIKVFESSFPINVKQYKTPSFFNRLVYTFVRPAKVLRAYRYAFELLDKGFDTPEPVGYILLKKYGLIRQSYFISIQSPYTRRFYEFGEGPVEGREDIIRAFARYTARLHEAGICHADYSPGNILFEKKDRQIRFMLVDINRMKFEETGLEKGCANFARLWGRPDFFRIIADEYARMRNFDAGECFQLIMEKRNKFWKAYTRSHPLPFDLGEPV
ncbi:MAG: lipopolysaccharide kinase InaA family protein [Parabacteroides sp.]|nr:lipopolysaccharide kinase InaA family protein [Parabacteroides sp.]